MTEEEMNAFVANVYSKLLCSELEPVKTDDIPNKLSEILNKCLDRKGMKADVTVDKSGITAKFDKKEKKV